MDKTIEFLINNWPIIAAIIVAVLSEFLAMNPKSKSNGLIQLLINVVKNSIGNVKAVKPRPKNP